MAVQSNTQSHNAVRVLKDAHGRWSVHHGIQIIYTGTRHACVDWALYNGYYITNLFELKMYEAMNHED